MCEKLLATQGANRAGGKGQVAGGRGHGAGVTGYCGLAGYVGSLCVDRLLLAPRIEINLASFQLCATNIHA